MWKVYLANQLSNYVSQDFLDAAAKICSFHRLQEGWRYGHGMPFSEGLIAISIRGLALGFSQGFTSADAFPGPRGDIEIAFYRGTDRFGFRFFPDGRILYLRENEEDIIEDRGISFKEMADILRPRGVERWNLLASFTSPILNQNWTGSGVAPLTILVTGAESRSFRESVSLKSQVAFVRTSESFTHQ